VNLAYK